MSMLVKKDSLTVTGLTKQFTRVADNSSEVTCVFCPECGVRLADTKWLRPDSFIWMKSAQGWVPVPDNVKALERQA